MEETPIVVENNEVTETTPSTPLVESEEAIQLEAQKAQLEAEIAGLEGTKQSLLDDVVRTRKEKKEIADESIPQIDIEAMKKELEESLSTQFSGELTSLKQELIQSKDSEIKAKKAVVDSINARMASVSGSTGQASSNPIVENEVELSNDEKEIAQEVGLANPRYLKDVEVRGL